MKVTPVSADLLIKVGIALAVAGAAYYIVKKGISGVTGAIDTITGLPGKAVAAVKEAAKSGGETWQAGMTPTPVAPNAKSAADNYQLPYGSPMINADGMDFSQMGGA